MKNSLRKIMEFILSKIKNKDVTSSFCIITCDYHIKYLKPLLDSLPQQTEAPNEIILVSSGMDLHSMDFVPETIKICDKDIPVVHINSRDRFFAGRARNLAADHSSSEILIFIDGDDIPHPQKIEISKAVLTNPDIAESLGFEEVDMTCHGWIGNKQFKKYNNIPSGAVTRAVRQSGQQLLIGSNNRPLAHGPIAIKTKIMTDGIHRQNEKQARAQDTAFCCIGLDKGLRVAHIDLPLIYYSNAGMFPEYNW